MKKVFEYLLALSFMSTIPLSSLIYIQLDHAERIVYSVYSEFDRMIPFVKVFIIPYMFWMFFLYLTLTYLCFKDRKMYYRALITYNIAAIVCYIIFYVFQTTVPRPELVGNDFLTSFVSYLYRADAPYNCFPSIHCMSCYLLFAAILRSNARTKVNVIVISILAWTIIISTLFVKQHAILDVLCGILLAEMIYHVVCLFQRKIQYNWKKPSYPMGISRGDG